MRFLLPLFFSFLLAACQTAPPTVQKPKRPIQHGDILFQSFGADPLSRAIMESTHSPYAHCGILVEKNGGMVVLEAIGPVQETPLPAWIAKGRDRQYAIYRVKEPLQAQVPAFVKAAYRYQGRPYDLQYQMDDSKIYCSELVYKAWHDATGGQPMGRLRTLGELDWRPHEMLIRLLSLGALPLDRLMITPRDLSESELLEVVRPLR